MTLPADSLTDDLQNEANLAQESGMTHVAELLDRAIATLRETRASTIEEAIAVYEKAFEQNWVVQDTIDATRALASADPSPDPLMRKEPE